jgi:hypothetical protein
VKTCHDAAPSDVSPLDLIGSSDVVLTEDETRVSEPSMDTTHIALSDMHDYELGEFLYEAFAEHDAEDSLNIL